MWPEDPLRLGTPDGYPVSQGLCDERGGNTATTVGEFVR
jgi:hypothetical protein